jgi:hypothetical protein
MAFRALIACSECQNLTVVRLLTSIGLPWVHPRPSTARNDFRYERRYSTTRARRMHVHMAFQEHSPRGAEGSIVPGRKLFSGFVFGGSLHTIIHFVDFLKAAKRETHQMFFDTCSRWCVSSAWLRWPRPWFAWGTASTMVWLSHHRW